MRKSRIRFNDDSQRYIDKLEKADLRSLDTLKKEHPYVMESIRAMDLATAAGFKVFVAGELHISLLMAIFMLLCPKRIYADRFFSLTAGKDLLYIQSKIKEEHHLKAVMVSDQRSSEGVPLQDLISYFK